MVRALARIGREMSEDRLGGAGDGHRQTLTAEIDELQAEKTRALAAGDTARAQDLQRRQAALYDKLHGSGPVVGAGGRVV